MNISFNVKLDQISILRGDQSRPAFTVNVKPYSTFTQYNPINEFISPVPQEDFYKYKIEDILLSPLNFTGEALEPANVTITYTTPSDFNLQQFIEFIPAQINNSTFSHDYQGSFTLVPTVGAIEAFESQFTNSAPNLRVNPNPPTTFSQLANTPDTVNDNLKATFGLSATLNQDNTISVVTSIVDLELNNYDGSNSSYTGNNDPTSVQNYTTLYDTDNTLPQNLNPIVRWQFASKGSLDDEAVLESTSNTTLVNEYQSEVPYDYSIVDLTPLQGFKAGSLHPLGIVYKDKWGRSSFVNKLGSAYVGWYNDHDRLREGVTKFDGEVILKEETLSGPASISIDFQSQPPEWADAFQIVYAGNSLTDSFIQYSAVGAFVPRKGDFPTTSGEFRDVDTESKRIYVGFDTLDIYRDQKNTVRDYSFTAGDKLRIKSAALQSNSQQIQVEEAYFSANDGGVIEFDVVGVELLTNDVTNPIAYNISDPDAAHGSLSSMDDRFTGKFLVLEAPQIAGGAESANGDQIKYVGWDWYHISYENTALGTALQTAYPDGSVVSGALNYWQRQPIVEIYNPKKSTASEFYYEIGEAVTIDRGVRLPVFDQSGDLLNPDTAVDYNTYHGPTVVLDTGDVHYRPVACKTSDWVDDDDDGTFEFKWYVKNDWAYKTKLLEDFSPSDIIDEKMWSKGRAHVEFKNAATVRRFNSITYSDAFVEDMAQLPLSSFNPTLANFGSLDSRYGALNYIYNYGVTGQLLGIQEDKVSLTDVNKNILFDAGGNQNIALSTKVLNSTSYYSADYGCGDNPESVLVRNNSIYFVDPMRKRVIRFSNGQMVPISEKGAGSRFNEIFQDWSTSDNSLIDNNLYGVRKVVSGYDPDDDIYYVSFYSDHGNLQYKQGGSSSYDFDNIYTSNEFLGYTMGYDVKKGYWLGKYSFVPMIYSHQNNTMYSSMYVEDASDIDANELTPLLFHKHKDNADSSNRTQFYNQETASHLVKVVSNNSPSLVKVYDAISIEGSDVPVSCNIKSSNGSENNNISLFDEREDTFYAVMPRDTNVGSSHYVGIGRCISIADGAITIEGSLSGLSIPIGAQVINQNGDDISGDPDVITRVTGVNGNEITVDNQSVFGAINNSIILVMNPAVDGDSIRGHFATIEAKFLNSSPTELFCVNLHVTNSSLHHGS